MSNFIGLTNKLTVENDIVTKESKNEYMYLNKENEYNVLKHLKHAKQDIMIKPIEFYFDNQNLISKFKVLKDFLTIDKLELNEKNLELVCYAIKQFHKIDIHKAEVKEFDYKKILTFFFKNIESPIFDYKKPYQDVLESIENIGQLEKVLSHNDLVPGNILINNNNIKLIDYDYVMINDCLFDLASFITETCNSNQEAIDIFISLALKNDLININQIDQLNTIIKYQDLLWTLWANYMYNLKHSQIYKEICEEKWERYKNRSLIK